MQKLISVAMLVAVALFLGIPGKATAQSITNLGTITIRNGLGWDADPLADGFYIYLSDTNNAASKTNANQFTRIATVTTNEWRGSASTNINGLRLVAVSAFATDSTNVYESELSERVILNFRAGVPQPPTNFRIYQVVQAIAQDAIRSVSQPPPPPPMPSVGPDRAWEIADQLIELDQTIFELDHLKSDLINLKNTINTLKENEQE